MNQPDDNPLHDWVRQSLAGYRPDYNPADWERLQRRVRRQRWRRWRILSGVALVGLSGLGWLLRNGDEEAPTHLSPIRSSTTARPVPVPTSIHPLQEVRSDVRLRRVKPPTPSLPPEQLVEVMPVRQPATDPTAVLPLPLMVPQFQNTQLADLTSRFSQVRWNREESAIAWQVKSGQFGSDSTSYRAIERNLTQWPDAVVVCDLTTSMYPYTTQLVSWLRSQATRPSLLGMVFFTDCDSLGRQTRPGGPPGRMYVVHDPKPDAILPALLAATHNTVRNEDDAENDVEALRFAQQEFPKAQHLILIADNLSRVKDIAQLATVDRPVHVVLCGTTGGDLMSAFQPDFEQIARQTKGSLHTMEDDLDPAAIPANTSLRVGPYYYRYNRRGQFQLTPFAHRPRRFLGFLWL